MGDHNQPTGAPTCARHPDRETLLSCTRCERPMCPDCLVSAAVGMQCVDCVGGPVPEERTAVRPRPTVRRASRRPSTVFLLLVGFFIGLCISLTQFPSAELVSETSSGLKVVAFLTVLVGWIVSLCLHEWAHAFVAYKSGDHSIVGRGYLDLDPRKYVDPVFSLAIPVLFLIMGGIGLPGGAVWVDHGNIRSRARQSMVSAAGPLVNLIFGVLCVLISQHLLVDSEPILGSTLMYLGFIQFATALLNLLPIPGLDGFGIIAPFLPPAIRHSLMALSSMIIMVLLFIVITTPGSLQFLWDGATNLLEWSGGDLIWAAFGEDIGRIQVT